eukprot:TRINITY_DN33987_c0_g1_i1.p1 TRINITY_DN33987_c0_g1~~TRINITY_DN33987_c0_g1_i1.p1  ORF type:complete len:479 (+),score=95.66 TRINITY_DN33987_c0_g1_i1:212-1438(+)
MRGSSSSSGRGITAELVLPENATEGLSISVATSRAHRGEAFVSALSAQLETLQPGGQEGLASLKMEDDGGPESGNASSRFKQESQAYYYYSKLLCDKQKAPGRAALNFIQRFTQTCAGLSPSAVQQGRPMSEVQAAVHQLCLLLEQEEHGEATPGKPKVVSELQAHVRPAVERCIFKHVGAPMWSLYERRHSAEDAQFLAKVEALAKIPDARLMEALEIRSEFRGAQASAVEGVPTNRDDGTTSHLSTAAGTEDAGYPDAGPSKEPAVSSVSSLGGSAYERAAAALSQLELSVGEKCSCIPRDALEVLSLAQLEMKTCALEASGGRAELQSMDDVMPLFVFVLVRSPLRRPFAFARYMTDSLTQDERLESEGRAVLLLESAARHIAFDWNLGPLGIEKDDDAIESAQF